MSASSVTRKLSSRKRNESRFRKGDLVVVTQKIFADPPVFPPANAVVEQVIKVKPWRHKDNFGTIEVHRAPDRVLVKVLSGQSVHAAHTGKTYWVNEDILESP